VSLTRSYVLFAGGWLASVVVALGLPIVLGTPTTPAESLAIVVLGCLPVMILPALFRGAPVGSPSSEANPSGAVRQ
jgi:hypothetical protein